MALNRRIFLKNSALAMVGVGAAPLWLQRAVYAAETPAQRKKILVAIFQRGAADGLNIVVPHGEKRYYELRPTLGIPQTTVIDLDGLFGLNPALSALKPIWDQGHLAMVHAKSRRSQFGFKFVSVITPGMGRACGLFRLIHRHLK